MQITRLDTLSALTLYLLSNQRSYRDCFKITMSIRTDKNQLALTRRRNESLSGAEEKDPGFSCQGLVGEFIGCYLRCDLFVTRLQNYYQTDKQYKKTGLNTKTLNEAFNHFGLHFSEEKVLILFQGGTGKRGRKSAKQLRNGYLHQLSKADKDEILTKCSVLIPLMSRLLKMRIKT